MSLACEAAEYLVKVPDGIWVAVTGSLVGASLTLLGVWRSNANSRRQLTMQLEHEAKRELAEREMTIRKEVFLEVASWASASYRKIAELIDTSGKDASEELGLEIVAIPRRVHVVGNNATIQAFCTFGLAVTEATTQIHPRRVALLASKLEFEQLKEAEQAATKAGKLDKALSASIGELALKLNDLARDLIKESFDQAEKLLALEAELTIAMRRELAMPLDEAAYRELSARTTRIQRLTVDVMLEELAKRRANK